MRSVAKVNGDSAYRGTSPVLSVRGLCKSYGGRTVVEDVSFDLMAGEVLALVGENGAGKSTTKNMLCGLIPPTSGKIVVSGEKPDPGASTAEGISAVHQELSLFGSLTVAENICIADIPGRPARIDWRRCNAIARGQLDFLGVDIDVDATVETLGAGKQQIVEIGKALLTANKVLILDEPTTSLTAPERQNLFYMVEDLRQKGIAIILISHFLEEIYQVCQSFVVLRDGRQVGAGKLADVPQRRLEEMMVGRTLDGAKIDIAQSRTDVALRVEELASPDFADVDFSLREGEILGISGLMGAGRTELAEAIFGLRPARGRVYVQGELVSPRTVDAMKRKGACYVPEDRRANGMFLNRPLRENLSAAGLAEFVRRMVRGIGFVGERARVADLVKDMNIAAPHLDSAAVDLSGGNQQKALLGRWLATEPEILIFDEPTKGVDIGAKFDIHQAIAELATQGRSIILVSSDLPELLALSHRILVMRKGRIVGELTRHEFDAVRIISIAASERMPDALDA